MKKVALNSISSIQTGYSFRNGLDVSLDGVSVVQLKDVQPSGIIDISSLNRVKDTCFSDQHRLNQGDLVFKSRGQDFSMGLIPASEKSIVIAAPLFKVTVDLSIVLPEYVAWYVNSSEAQLYFESVAEGSSIKMVSKGSLAELPIPLPPISVQKTIAELANFYKQEKMLSELLLKKRELLISTRIQGVLRRFNEKGSD